MNVFDILKEKINISDIISKYLTLRRAGAYLKGKCPFHSEKTASFTVSPDKGIFYCFGCHIGGDAIAFIAKVESCSQIEAAKIIANDYNIELPNLGGDSKSWQDAKDRYIKTSQLLETWCHQMLLSSKEALNYLFSRGIKFDVIKLFKIGFFPGDLISVKSFINFCSQNNVLVQDLCESKLLLQNKVGYYSPFEGRIVFSIKDNLGRILGFGGRIFEPNDTRPKYYNSHDNNYFKKGSLLFGLDIAKKAIQEKGELFLVEGYIDVIMMVQSGFKNTVATLGTACTQEHLTQIAQYADKIYILYDSDKAGHNAIIRMVELCWNANLELFVIKLPQGHDPASFLQQKDDLNNLIKSSSDIFDFILESYGENFKSQNLSEKLKLTKKVVELISKIKDNIKRHILLQRASELFEIPMNMLKSEAFNVNLTKLPVKEIPIEHKSETNIKNSNEITLLEKNIFSVIIYNKGELDPEEEKFLIQFFQSPYKELLIKIAEFKTSELFNIGSIFSSLTDEERNLVSSFIIESSNDKDRIAELLTQFYRKQWKLVVAKIRLEISHAQQIGDTDLVKNLLNRLETLRNKILKRGVHGQEN